MKTILLSLIFSVFVSTTFGQTSYFECNEITLFITNGNVTLNVPTLSKQNLEKKIMSFIQERNYVFKSFYSNENTISFRDFAIICDKNTCGSTLVAKNIFHLTYGDGFVKITLDYELYSSFFGAELVINENDDVASKNNVAFGLYEFQIPEQYADEYPESIYSFNRKGKVKIKNPGVQKTILEFYNQYIIDIKHYLEN